MELEKCINYNGKKYCWNSETKEINEITVTYKVIDPANCPSGVIKDLLALLDMGTEKKE